MNQPYHQHFTVRLHDLDAWKQVRTNVLLQYLEATATAMSGAMGFPAAWYEAAGTAWSCAVSRSSAAARPPRTRPWWRQAG